MDHSRVAVSGGTIGGIAMRNLIQILCVFFILQSGEGIAKAQEPPLQSTIAALENEISSTLEEHNVTGLAVAAVDKQGVLWCHAFGVTDYRHPQAVTPDTIFSIQSMSKTVTTTAIMLAVQDGLLDLDVPIDTYLPNFRVNSIFEDHPERKITLRHLLSHTAGFTHEAPDGNNFDLNTGTFEEHIRSISQTWLRFPVGENYAYSNLGMDLAAYILQVKSGMPFDRYVRIKLFEPLGMLHSTIDQDLIARTGNRATGHNSGYPQVPLRIPMIGAGGVYTSARDLAQLIRFFLNSGRVDNQQILKEDLLNAMTAPPLFSHGQTNGYGLGLARLKRSGPRIYGHSGGGFGFESDMYWYPDLGIGALVLTNSAGRGILQNLVFTILSRFAEGSSPNSPRETRAVASGAIQKMEAWTDPGKDLIGANKKRLSRLLNGSEGRKAAYRKFVGDYSYQIWGKRGGAIKIRMQNGFLSMNDQSLYEYMPGLFFSADGEALDFRGENATWRNIKMNRVSFLLWQETLFGTAILCLAGLITWTAIKRSIRKKRSSHTEIRGSF